jgi:hypothetical protein
MPAIAPMGRSYDSGPRDRSAYPEIQTVVGQSAARMNRRYKEIGGHSVGAGRARDRAHGALLRFRTPRSQRLPGNSDGCRAKRSTYEPSL